RAGEVGMALEVPDILEPACREVVEHMNRVPLIEQQVAQVRPDEARAPGDQVAHLTLAVHACGVGRRLWRSAVPPNPPSTRIATPPPISASVDPSPPEPRERSARSTAAGTPASTPPGVAGAPRDGVPRPPRPRA